MANEDKEPRTPRSTNTQEAAPQENSGLYRILFENANVAISCFDLEGKICALNHQGACSLGGRPEDFLGQSPEDLFDPAVGKEYRRRLAAAVAEEGHQTYEDQLALPTGEQWFLSDLTRIVDADGRVLGVQVVSTEITKFKRTALKLAKSQRYLDLVYNSSSDLLALVEVEAGGVYKLVSFNDAYWRQLQAFNAGRTKEQIEGVELLEFGRLMGLPETLLQEYSNKFDLALETRRSNTTVEAYPTPAGDLYLKTVVSPIFDDSGACSHILYSSYDITDLKRAEQQQRKLEQQLFQAQKLDGLGLLAGGIAHDFNNLLTAIAGNAQLALNSLPNSSPAYEMIRESLKATARATELTHQMLVYSGGGYSTPTEVDLRVLVEEMAELLHSSIAKKAALQLDLSEDLPAISADASQIRQVVMNLIINASEALGAKTGRIAITVRQCRSGPPAHDGAAADGTRPEGPFVLLEVEDSGCGMDEATLAKVFDPFFSTKFTGRGLGMAGVHGIVSRHEAQIEIESEPGAGTTIRVRFPALDHPASPERGVEQPEVDWCGSGTILNVDDEDVVRRVSQSMLQRFGFTVISAADGVEAVNVFRERHHEIACVLLDLMMPRMDGVETFAALQKIDDRVPVILSSGYSEPESTKRFVGMDLAGFVQKPFRLTTLSAAIRKALGDRE